MYGIQQYKKRSRVKRVIDWVRLFWLGMALLWGFVGLQTPQLSHKVMQDTAVVK